MTEHIAIGDEVSNYRIAEVLGQGGMGTVYRAQHPQIGKQVAIKLLRKDVSQQPDAVQRFFQEARAVNDIHHENIVDILDFGKTKSDEYFLLMELLEGQNLATVLHTEAPLPTRRVGHIGLQICSALSAAHEKGILHRDLKPDNIFLITRSGRKDFVKILDFGIAKFFQSTGTQTHTGIVLGTPLYMAPEQALGEPLDQQTDIYGFGVLLYYMATGTLPLFDPNPVNLASMHVTTRPPKPKTRFSRVHRGLEKVILRCLEKKKEHRYFSMKELASDLASACSLKKAIYFGLDPDSIHTKSLSSKAQKELLTATDMLSRTKKKRSRYFIVFSILALACIFGVLSFFVWFPQHTFFQKETNEKGSLLSKKEKPSSSPTLLPKAPIVRPDTQISSSPVSSKDIATHPDSLPVSKKIVPNKRTQAKPVPEKKSVLPIKDKTLPFLPDK